MDTQTWVVDPETMGAFQGFAENVVSLYYNLLYLIAFLTSHIKTYDNFDYVALMKK